MDRAHAEKNFTRKWVIFSLQRQRGGKKREISSNPLLSGQTCGTDAPRMYSTIDNSFRETKKDSLYDQSLILSTIRSPTLYYLPAYRRYRWSHSRNGKDSSQLLRLLESTNATSMIPYISVSSKRKEGKRERNKRDEKSRAHRTTEIVGTWISKSRVREGTRTALPSGDNPHGLRVAVHDRWYREIGIVDARYQPDSVSPLSLSPSPPSTPWYRYQVVLLRGWRLYVISHDRVHRDGAVTSR